MVFERRIYGHTKERNGTWRINSNEELNKFIQSKNILNYIKAQILACFEHVHRMSDNRMVEMYMNANSCQQDQ
jgi:hypothetical protein